MLYLELNDNNLSMLDIYLMKIGKIIEIYSQYYPNIYKVNVKIDIREVLETVYNKKYIKKLVKG